MLSPWRLKDKLFYGWVVVATLVITGTTFWGIRLSFGVFFKSIENEFQLSRAATSSIYSTHIALGCIFSLLGGWALDKYGPRIVLLVMALLTGFSLILASQTDSLWQLFITYGLLLAMGTAATYVVIMSIVSRWFDKRRGLALGIAGLGQGLGTVIMAPFATYLISNFDWRTAFIVIGLIVWLIVIPMSRLLRRDPYEIGALPDGIDSLSKDINNKEGSIQPPTLSLLQASRTRSLKLIMVMWVFYAYTGFLILAHLVPHATDIGISAGEAAAVLSLMGGTTMAGRVLMGIISDKMGRKLIATICSLLQAGAMVWLIWSQDLWTLYLFAVVYGFARGGFSTSMAALIGETFGSGRIGSIFGVLEVSFGIGAAIGPAIGGFIFDVSNSYSTAFLIGGVVMLIVTLLVPLIRREMGLADILI